MDAWNQITDRLWLAPDAAGAYVEDVNAKAPDSTFPKARPSASADASRAAEYARLRAMTVEERIKEALSLKHRFQALLPTEHR